MKKLGVICNRNENIIKSREPYLDVAKGLGMLFIIFGHLLKSGLLRQLVFSFHVPLFFVLTGLTFKPVTNGNGFWSFVKVKFSRLMIPYYAASVLSVLVFQIVLALGIEVGGVRRLQTKAYLRCFAVYYMGILEYLHLVV